jgi:hypothetical protein
MDPAAQSWALIVGWGIVVLFTTFGIGLILSNAENIERPLLVGGITMLGGGLVAYLLARTQSLNGPYSWWQIFGFFLVAAVMYGWARLIDYALGPKPLNREADEETMGAHLAD